MLIVAFRHGNTFAPGEPVVCAGRQNGLALVASGLRQAEHAGRALAEADIRVARVWASPRLRARQFAVTLQRTAAQARGVAANAAACQRKAAVEAEPSDGGVAVDARLDEIDYGPWTGRTRADIEDSGAAAAVHAWDRYGIWPEDAGFGDDESGVRAQLAAWLAEATADAQAATDGVVLAVSHGGRLRYLPTLVHGALPRDHWPGPHKVRCGHATVVRLVGGALELLGADLDPAALARTLRAASTTAPTAVVPRLAARLT